MHCQEYLSLPEEDQMLLLGKTIHLLQNDTDSFQAIASLVRSAEQSGKFDKVKFGHHQIQEHGGESLPPGQDNLY